MRRAGGVTMVFIGLLLCSCTLHYYAKTGNVEGVKDAVTGGAKINSLDDRSETPLMVAAFSGKPLVVDYLCQNGADINARNPNGATALIWATYYGHFDVVKVLLKYNPDKTIKDKYKNTALDYAEYYNFPGIVALLKADDPQSIPAPKQEASAKTTPKAPVPVLDPTEPWTGKWMVEGSPITIGLWAFKQRGVNVVSTSESYFEATGSISGDELQGNYSSVSLRKNLGFKFILSADKMSFTGYAADQNGTKPVHGVRQF